MLKKYFPFILLLLSFSVSAQSEGIPERPRPDRLVNNLSQEFPHFLPDAFEGELERKLVDFANETSNQIVVVIVDDLGGMEPWDYATQLGQKWGAGQSANDNGIVILIKPTGGKGQRKMHIAVGSGLEGAIPDATANQIADNELGPGLASGDYYGAIDKTVTTLMALAKGEFDSDAYAKKNKKGIPKGIIIPLMFLILFLIFRFSRGNRGGGSGGMSMGTGFLLGSMFRGGGGGFGGGGSSGGFGGFGGGGFGGGGAGGSW